MRRISRVLCAVDIDDADRSAFDQALALARAWNATLLLLCPVDPREPLSRRASERSAYLLQLRRAAKAAGVGVHVSVNTGDTPKLALRSAVDRRADILVISVEHGRSEGRAWGKVAEDVLRSAPCPTLVVPAGAEIRSTFTNVMCAVDVAFDGQTPVPEALPLCDQRNATLTLFHVVSDRVQATAALSQLAAAIPDQVGVPTVAQIAIGAVAQEILEAARAVQPDLLVIGARQRTRVGRKLFGVTRALLASSFCSVLAVPPMTFAPAARPAA